MLATNADCTGIHSLAICARRHQANGSRSAKAETTQEHSKRHASNQSHRLWNPFIFLRQPFCHAIPSILPCAVIFLRQRTAADHKAPHRRDAHSNAKSCSETNTPVDLTPTRYSLAFRSLSSSLSHLSATSRDSATVPSLHRPPCSEISTSCALPLLYLLSSSSVWRDQGQTLRVDAQPR